jgi:hypothetical protein
MLTPEEAETIVKDCIRQVRGSVCDVPVEKPLKQVGIPSSEYVNALRDEIVTNPKIGVPSKGHKIKPNDLAMNPDTPVNEVRDQVADKAVPAE